MLVLGSLAPCVQHGEKDLVVVPDLLPQAFPEGGMAVQCTRCAVHVNTKRQKLPGLGRWCSVLSRMWCCEEEQISAAAANLRECLLQCPAP